MIKTIFAENIITKENINSTNHCPNRRLVTYLDKDETNKIITISGDTWRSNISSETPEFCDASDSNKSFFLDDEKDGCCITKNKDISIDNCPDGHSMGFLYSFNNSADILQGSSKPYYLTAEKYNICHKEPVQTLFSFFDDPNEFSKFFKLLVAMLFVVIVSAILATCSEFWIRYGNSIDCLYYYANCKNISPIAKLSKDNSSNAKYNGDNIGKATLIDYIFPSSIYSYPYQKCVKIKNQYLGKQYGGNPDLKEGFNSNFSKYSPEQKCITLDSNDFSSDERPFPYNIPDFETNSVIITILLKFITFFFLFPVLFTRQFIQFILTKLSEFYTNFIIKNPISNNILFCIFFGGFGILSLLMGIITFFANPGFSLIYTLFIVLLFWNFYKLRIIKKNYHDTAKFNGLEELNNDILSETYYNIGYYIWKNYFYDVIYYSSKNVSKDDSPYEKFKHGLNIIWNFVLNILFTAILLIILIITFILGIISSSSAMFYLYISTIFNYFRVPFSNVIEMLDILKDHSSLLTIIFCLSVITSSAFSFDNVTTGIISFFVAILILYKILKYKNKL